MKNTAPTTLIKIISLKFGGAKTVDIENYYYPYVEFKFDSNTEGKIFLLVLVNSSAKGHVRVSKDNREVANSTKWGNY